MSHYTYSTQKTCGRHGSRCAASAPTTQHFAAQDENVREALVTSAMEEQDEYDTAAEYEHPQDLAIESVTNDDLISMDEAPQKKEYSNNGETWCDRESGEMQTTITNTKCTKSCTEEHEADHRTYRKDCCKVYSTARKKAVDAGDWRTRNKLTKRYNKWIDDTSDFSECRAYKKSIECGKKKRNALSCLSPKKTLPKKEDKSCCKDLRAYLKAMKKKRKNRCPGTDKPCPAFT